jgi:purine nucleosidase
VVEVLYRAALGLVSFGIIGRAAADYYSFLSPPEAGPGRTFGRGNGLFVSCVAIIRISLACLFCAPTGNAAPQLPYAVPDEKRVRVIVSSDAANEVDDPFAIVHALLTPQFIVKGIVAAHFGDRVPGSMEKSRQEIGRLLELSGFKNSVPALSGAEHPIPDEHTAAPSTGADLIIREALSEDAHPLYVICCGPLTDVASAYLQKPEIAGHLTIVWTGGGPYPNGAPEFNLGNDVAAANVIMQSPVALWQVPSNVYSMVRVGTAELCLKVKPCGQIGQHLFANMMAFNELKKKDKGWPRGEDWTLGDSILISLIMDPGQHTDFFDMVPAPRISPDKRYLPAPGSRKIRVYKSIDGRAVLEDMFAKVQLAYGQRP